MNSIWNKLVVTVVLFISLWQFNLLTQKFKPLVANISQDATPVQAQQQSPMATYTNSNEVLGEETLQLLPERIQILKIGLDLPIVAVPLSQGTWEVLPNVANYAVGTSKINDVDGNVGIYGHAVKEVFGDLSKLEIGDLITIYSSEKIVTYEVSSSTVVEPEQVEVFYPTPKPTLTLVTCSGKFSEMRYVVVANLININDHE